MAFGPLDTILLFGDSLTQGGWEAGGFAQRLAYVYARKLDVINRGLSGYNSEWSMPVFKEILPKSNEPGPKVKLLVLWLGANDACIPPSPQYVPIDRFVENLRQMVGFVHGPTSQWYSPSTRIILVTAPPFSETVRGATLAARDPPQTLDRTAKNTKAYAEAVLELAKELNLPVVDFYTAVDAASGGADEGLEKFLSDGLHLTVAGYAILYDKLVETIASSYPELNHETLPMVYPGLLLKMFLQILVASLFTLPFTSAEIHNVFVGGPNGLVFTPNNIVCNVGDTVLFTFGTKNHTMTQSTFANPCTPIGGGAFSGFMPVAANQTTDLPQYPLPVQDTKPFWAFCSQANHCEQGMVFAMNAPTTGNTFDAYMAGAKALLSPTASTVAAAPVAATSTATDSSAAAAVTPATTAAPYGGGDSVATTSAATGLAAAVTGTAPATAPATHTVVVGGSAGIVYTPNSITANPGDTVQFQFQVKNHTLTQSTFAAPCAEKAGGFDSGFMPVAATDTTFPTYTITVNDTTPIWAYCRQATHCEMGMVFAINAPTSGTNTFDAFKTAAMSNSTATSSYSTAAASATVGSGVTNGAIGAVGVKLPLVTLAVISMSLAAFL
ncbi:hypothetical protein FRB98_007503 [Tulasnella sp. 332]|nr:hypothetical protein FRB98_007503 [Tulasnella sp. 332]